MISPENFLALVVNLQRINEFVRDRRGALSDHLDASAGHVDALAEESVAEGQIIEAVSLDKAA